AVADCREDPRLRYPEHALKYGLISYLGLPVRLGDRVLGVLVFNTNAPRVYSEGEIAYLSAFADHAAIAIENARLHETTVRRAQFLATLNDLSRVLATELDPQRLAQQILASAQTLISGAAGRLWRRAAEDDVLEVLASLGLHDPEGGVALRLRPGEGLPGIAAATRRPVMSQDVTQDPRFLNQAWAVAEGLVACLVLPLIYGDQVRGALAIYTRAPHIFTNEQVGVLVSFAAQAAIALEKARLFEATERTAREIRSLYEVTHTLTTSLDPKEVLDLISVKATELLGTPHAQVVLWDENTKTLRLGAAHGAQAEKVRQQQFRLGEGVIGVVAETRAPLIVNGYQAYAKRVPGMTEIIADIAVPLLYRDRLLGILNSHATKPGWTFTENHLALLSSFADQAAIAIENARLYDTIRHHATELEARVRQRTAELEEALRFRVEFLGKMSHELRTPLNFVIGFSELLQQKIAGPLTTKQATYVDRVLNGGQRLLSLVNDVLDIAQLDAGKSALHLDRVILGPLIQEVLGLVRIPAAQKRLKVTTVLAPWLPFIVADRFKLAQILHNLVSNAVKFTPEDGSIRIITRQVPTAGDGGSDANVKSSVPRECVELVVEDTGIG
ncbi:MAG: GAF domain-containing protein, partial [Candidatus Methylomirabilales bacterium]